MFVPSAAPSGHAVFTARCSGCHTLTGNESRHLQGGDLIKFRMARATMVQFTAAMPVGRPLSNRELAAVVDYVRRLQARS